MGKINNLNFKVILDDAAFNKQVQDDIRAAKELNINLSNYLDIKKKAQNQKYISKEEAQTAKRLSDITRTQAVNEERIAKAKLQTQKAQIQLNKAIAQQNIQYSTQEGLLSKIKSALYGGTAIIAAQKFVRELVNISGEFEKQKVSLEAITQDIIAADEIYEQIRSLAVESPFTFKELAIYTKQLSAFSIPTNELFETTKMLADVSAGLGVGMDRIILAYGQIRSASFLRGQEVRQLTEAGIPILNMLAEKFTEIEGAAVSAAEVFDKISAREVPFEMVEEVFKEMTSEGGKFYQMQETLSETLSGKISNLTDAYQNMLSEIGDKNKGVIVGAVDTLRGLIDNYEKIGKVLVSLAAIYGAYKAAVIGANVVLKAQAALLKTNQAAAMLHTRTLNVVIAKLGKLAAGLNVYGLIAAGIAAVGVAIYNLATAETEEEKARKRLSETESSIQATVDERITKAKELIDVIRDETSATEDKMRAYENLKSLVPTLTALYSREGIAVEQLTNLYRILNGERGKYTKEEYEKKIAATEAEIERIQKDRIKISPAMYSSPGAMAAANSNIGAGKKVKELEIYLEGLKKDLHELDELEKQAIEERINDTNIVKYIDTAKKTLSKYNITSPKGSYGLWIDYDNAHYKEYGTYLKQLRDRWAELKKEIRDAGSVIDTSSLIKQKKIIEDIIAAFGVSLTETEPTTAVSTKTKKSPFSDAIEDLKELIDLIEQYNELVETGMTQNIAKELVFGKDYSGTTDIETAINEFYSKVLGKDVSLDFSFGSNLPEEQLKGFGATDQQIQDLEKGTDMAMDYRNKQIEKTVDLMKNARDLAEEQKTTEEKIAELEKKIADISALDMDDETKNKAIDELNEQITELKSNLNNLNLTKFWQIINDLGEEDNFKVARDYIKDAQDFLNKVKDGNIGEKDKKGGRIRGVTITKAQAREQGVSENLIEQIFGDSNNDEIYATTEQIKVLTEKIRDLEKAWQISNAPIYAFFNSLKDGQKDTETEIEYLVRLREEGESASTAIADLSSTLSGLANSMGKENLGSIISSVGSEAGSVLKDVTSIKTTLAGKGDDAKLDKEDIFSIANSTLGIFSTVASVFSTIIGIVTSIKELNEALARANQEAQQAIETARDARAIDMYAGIFGTDELGQMQEYAKIAKKYRDSVLNAQSTLNSKYTILDNGSGKTIRKMDTQGVYADTRNWWQKLWGSTNGLTSLNDFLESNGGLNYDNLKAFYDSYSSYLSEENKLLIEGLLSDWEQYEDAIEQIDSYAESIFGSTAENIADAWIEAFLETGNAATDLGDVVSGVAEQMAKDVIKSMLIDNIFTDDTKKQIVDYLVNGDVDKAAEFFDTLVTNADGLLPTIQAFLEKMEPYMTNDGNSDLDNDIEGITEDTAELLASYINGIRADVSIAKLQRETIIKQITALTATQCPNLSEYLNTISAHAFDISKNTQDILSTLESVITTEAGFPSFRILEE